MRWPFRPTVSRPLPRLQQYADANLLWPLDDQQQYLRYERPLRVSAAHQSSQFRRQFGNVCSPVPASPPTKRRHLNFCPLKPVQSAGFACPDISEESYRQFQKPGVLSEEYRGSDNTARRCGQIAIGGNHWFPWSFLPSSEDYDSRLSVRLKWREKALR